MLRALGGNLANYRLMIAGFALLCVPVTQADAAVILSVDSIQLSKPIAGTQSFSLLVSAEAVGQDETIFAYQMPFDVDPPNGTGLPAGLVLTGATRVGGPGFLFNGNATFAGEDLLVTDVLNTTITAGTTLGLFTLDFQATDALAVGSYTVDLNEFSPAFSVAEDSMGTSIPSSVVDGTITAVPEPGSMAALAAIGCVGAVGGWRRRRNKQAANAA